MGMISVFNYNAGKGDCIRIRYKGISGNYHNIIIDSGVVSFGTKYADIARELESMGECIDVAVISHVDNDHLGGLLYNLRSGVHLPIKEVWMNHGNYINRNVLLSVRQNDELFTRLQNQSISVKSVTKGNVYELDGAIFRILWPNDTALQELFRSRQDDVLLSRKSDYGYSFSELMDMPIKKQDLSRNNRASVIMELEYLGAKMLFTGDAWAEDILQVAEDGYDLVKLAHHGSVRNISEEWGEKIKCNNYMICTDGVMHPDKQTIAKLLKWYGNICIYGAADWWKKMSKDEPMDVCKHVQYEKGEYVWRAEKL